MLKLLKLEYYKNLNYRPFIIFTILYFIILTGMLFIGFTDLKLTGNNNLNLKDEGMYNYPAIWNFTTYFASILKIFLGLMIVFSISQEFTTRMFKQNIIDGLSRKEFIISKLLTITIYTLASVIVVFTITFYLGNTYSNVKDSEMVFKEIYFIGNYFLKLFTFLSFLMFLSILLRKSVFVFLALFIYWIFENIFVIIENRIILRDVDPKNAHEMLENSFALNKFLPLESMSSLITGPLARLNTAKAIGIPFKLVYPTESVIMCIVWTIVFILSSYWILKKRNW